MSRRPLGPSHRPTIPGRFRVGGPALGALLLGMLLLPSSGAGQERTPPPTDPDEALERARSQQEAFERLRAGRIPVERRTNEGGCDASIGRICIWFGGEGEEDFPDESVQTGQARRGFIGVLLETDQVVDDPWVTGQLVHYLVEEGDHRYAEQIATQCELPDDAVWWCDALLGYSLHVRSAFVEAGDAFRDALSSMPPAERQRWLDLYPVVTEDAEEALGAEGPEARYQAWERFWRLSDPLYLVPGNDRFTDHMARMVQVVNREDATNPQQMDWDDDMAETLLRYGRVRGYSRTHDPSRPGMGGGFQVQDTRRVVGHHHPRSRGYLFPERFLESPSEIPPESWITAPRAARTWYAPPYAPDFRGLESQVGRFRRTAEMLVVGAYQPAPSGVSGADRFGGTQDPFDDPPGEVEAGLFLVPVDGGPEVRVGGTDASGVFRLLTDPGSYVASLEVFEPRRLRAWRARQGVRQEPLLPGLVSVSDLLILEEGAPAPTDLEEAIPHVRPGIRVRSGERFRVVWEVYGLGVQEDIRVTVGFTEGRPGFLERVGEFLGVYEPDEPVEITFDDVGPDRVQTVFRSLELELPPALEPGEHTLHLRLQPAQGEAVVSSRPIVVEPAGGG